MTAWDDAIRIGTLFAVDPAGTGGIALRARAGPVRDRFMATLGGLLEHAHPLRRMPSGITDDRLLGGLDLAATLGSGRPVGSRGLLADADGGILVVAMAERLGGGTAARLNAAIDTGRISAERDGFTISEPSRFGIVALDEGEADEQPPESLLDRLGFRVGLDEISFLALAPDVAPAGGVENDALVAARDRIASIAIPFALLEALTATAAGLGIVSYRAVMLAIRVACAAASLAGRSEVAEEDASEAAQLVLAPRAVALPPPQEQEQESEPVEDDTAGGGEDRDEDASDTASADIVLEAAKAAIPPDLLARIAAGAAQRSRQSGRMGAAHQSGPRGRPAGSRPGKPRDGARLDVLATLRAAAPLQRLRGGSPGSVQVRAQDFRIVRRVQRARTTTIFLVDASGSSALNRLAEAKGAVELLLAECYVRRDRVALIAFRGRTADIVLAPTSSLTRARRSLAGLAGGGGTPLAAALDAAASMSDAVRRQEGRAVIVMLTDGRANVARDGAGDRARAGADAVASGHALRFQSIPALLIDTSPRPAAPARALADAMGAIYLPLPQGDAAAMAKAVKAASI